MKKILLLVCIAMMINAAYAKEFTGKPLAFESDSTRSRAVVKMNLSSLFLLNFSFQAEYAVHKRVSLALGYYRILPLRIPGELLGVANVSGKFNGYSFTPEVRLYTTGDYPGAPRGFYVAPYFRYTRYSLQGSYTGLQGTFNGTLNGVARSYAPGMMIGYQLFVNRNFAIDFYIAGLHFGKRKYDIEVQNSNIRNLGNFEQDNLLRDAAMILARKSGIDSHIEDDRMMLKFKTGHWGFRGLGINLGFAF